MFPLPYCVYVLYSDKDGKFYMGFTTNIQRRLEEHNNGKTRSTASRRPLKLVYCEYHLNKHDALRREGYFKTSAGKRAIKIMIRESINSL